MAQEGFIQVILPLRLEWEPYYELEGAVVGERVKVEFAHRDYIGVVSRVGVKPEVEKVLPAQHTELPPISPSEIQFWRTLADYYLCTPGEVYKAAYPSVLRQGKPRKVPVLSGKLPAPIPLPPEQESALSAVSEAFRRKKTVLLEGQAPELYLELARRTLAEGKSVLYLVPEIALTEQLEARVKEVFPDVLVYHSAQTTATRRAVATVVREQAATLVLGTRSALFLPHHNLGLVLVDQEQDPSYKQDSPAPRYHARESAILLGSILGAHVLLGSATPSLESLYNAETGLFTQVYLRQHSKAEVLLVNTSAEARKNGMSGSFSLKLLAAMKDSLDAGEKVQLVCRSKAAVEECRQEIQGIFPAADIEVTTPATAKLAGDFPLIAVLQADGLLGKDDFRADEKALQLLQLLLGHCGRQLVIQTRESRHPVFQALSLNGLTFLEERRVAGYPPVTRMIDIVLRDKNLKRLEYLSSLLARQLGFLPMVLGPIAPVQDGSEEEQVRIIRILLPRDRQLRQRKSALLETLNRFEKERRYQGHIVLDVDPL